tara:strand:- start:264 stop:773 length:510 start_codon:yes stop_codon:yes gene_type:complete
MTEIKSLNSSENFQKVVCFLIKQWVNEDEREEAWDSVWDQLPLGVRKNMAKEVGKTCVAFKSNGKGDRCESMPVAGSDKCKRHSKSSNTSAKSKVQCSFLVSNGKRRCKNHFHPSDKDEEPYLCSRHQIKEFDNDSDSQIEFDSCTFKTGKLSCSRPVLNGNTFCSLHC